MTLDFYNLKEEPFGFLPDSRFLYLSSTHRQALASLLRALQGGRGFVTLTAKPGLGKTTLLFHTLNSFGDRVATVYLFQAPQTPVDLLRAVLADLGVHENAEDVEGMLSQLRVALVETHRLEKRIIIVIDEAQNLDPSLFYPLCALSNLSTLGTKLIQFILCGQPSLSDKLAAIQPFRSMEHLAAAQLEPFSVQDTAEYVDHRLRTAGYKRESPLFTPEAVALVAHYSQGTPRVINRLCFESLSTAYRYRRQRIGDDTVHEAAAALDLDQSRQKTIVARPLPVSTAVQSSRPLAAQEKPLAALRQAPADRLPIRPPLFAQEYVAGSRLAAGQSVAEQALALSSATAQKQLALPKGAFLSKIITLHSSQAAASQARSSRLPARLVSRPVMGLIAAILLAGTGAVYGIYRAQTVPPAAKQTVAATPLRHGSRRALQEDQTSAMIAAEVKTVPAATHPNMHVAPDHSAANHDLKGMDLQSALQALSNRKRREQADPITEDAPARR